MFLLAFQNELSSLLVEKNRDAVRKAEMQALGPDGLGWNLSSLTSQEHSLSEPAASSRRRVNISTRLGKQCI